MSAARVDRHDHGLRAEFGANFANQLRPRQRRGVDADFVRARIENRSSFVRSADAAPHRERHKELPRRASDRFEQRASGFVGRRDVKKDDFVGAAGSVAGSKFRGVPGIDEVDELHPLDHAAGVDVETGDDAPGQHGFHSRKL